MYSPFKMKPKSPILKALVGKQNNLPAELKAKIEAAPESPAKMMKKSPTKEKSVSFNDAFASARKAGKDTFMYKDKEYHTAKKGEGKTYKASYDKGASYSVVDKSGKIARFGESSTSPSKMQKESMAKMAKKSPSKMMKKSPSKMMKKK